MSPPRSLGRQALLETQPKNCGWRYFGLGGPSRPLTSERAQHFRLLGLKMIGQLVNNTTVADRPLRLREACRKSAVPDPGRGWPAVSNGAICWRNRHDVTTLRLGQIHSALAAPTVPPRSAISGFISEPTIASRLPMCRLTAHAVDATGSYRTDMRAARGATGRRHGMAYRIRYPGPAWRRNIACSG